MLGTSRRLRAVLSDLTGLVSFGAVLPSGLATLSRIENQFCRILARMIELEGHSADQMLTNPECDASSSDVSASVLAMHPTRLERVTYSSVVFRTSGSTA